MPRQNYLGEHINLSRVTFAPAPSAPSPPGPDAPKVVPAMGIVDPNAEPLVITAFIQDYPPDHLPLREIHVFVVPTGIALPDADSLIQDAANRPYRAQMDVTNIKNQTVHLPGIEKLPDGAWVIQTVLVGGTD